MQQPNCRAQNRLHSHTLTYTNTYVYAIVFNRNWIAFCFSSSFQRKAKTIQSILHSRICIFPLIDINLIILNNVDIYTLYLNLKYKIEWFGADFFSFFFSFVLSYFIQHSCFSLIELWICIFIRSISDAVCTLKHWTIVNCVIDCKCTCPIEQSQSG